MVEEMKNQEARNFVGKKGPEYVCNSATLEEKKHFKGTLYDEQGSANLSIISYFSSPLHL